jgi:hypothetical protein
LGSSADGLAEKYAIDRQDGEVFNASLAGSIDEVLSWNERYGMKMSEEPLALFREYLDSGDYVIFQSLVEHPWVPNFQAFRPCSVVLQRGDIYYANGTEDLFLRSWFHSGAEGTDEFVNFGPAGGIHLSFATDSIWYPLRVTRLNREPTRVVLNLHTVEPLGNQELPRGFALEKTGRARFGVARFTLSRLTATFEGGEDIPDFRLSVE